MKSNYSTLKEWYDADKLAYIAAKKKGLIEDICKTFGWVNSFKTIWTKEMCLEEALKYAKRKDWVKNNYNSYHIAKKNGWYYECTKHMFIKIKWTKEKCLEDALKYDTKEKWRYSGGGGPYSSARKNGWYEECTAHMISVSKQNGYWTKEKCLEDASKYTNKTEWLKNSGGAVKSAKKNDWYNECTTHMIQIHKPKGYWTKERCVEDASKYKTRSEWIKNSGAYEIARVSGWLSECAGHMFIKKQNPTGFWTKENCLKEALKYKTKSEWRKNGAGSYDTALTKKNWYNECTTHMIQIHKPKGYWTKERCVEDALKYDTKQKWRKNSGGSYSMALKKKDWFKECTTHMKFREKKPAGFWENKENCLKEALKYSTKSEWSKNSNASYYSTKKYGWYDECISHMDEIQKPNHYWNDKKLCMEEALKYKTKSEWQRGSSSSYVSAKKNGWFDECIKHM